MRQFALVASLALVSACSGFEPTGSDLPAAGAPAAGPEAPSAPARQVKAADPVLSTLTVAPDPVVANGTAAAGITVTVSDRHGNPLAGQPVVFSASGGGNSFSATSGVTGAAGTVSTALSSSVAEAKTVNARVGSGLSAFTLTGTTTFVAGDPSASQTTLTSSASPTADGASGTTVMLRVRDESGNVVKGLSGLEVRVSGSGNVTSPAAIDGSVRGSTDANGTFAFTLASTTAELKTVVATVPRPSAGTPLLIQTQILFSAGAPAPSASAFEVSPSTVVADGASVSTLVVTARDAFGNAVAGAAVALSATGSGNTISPASGVTASDGVFTASLTSTVAEEKRLTADVAGAVTLTATVAFVPGDPDPAHCSFVASPSVVVADDDATATLILALRDAHDNAVGLLPGISVSAGGSNNTLAPATGSTDGAGIFATSLKSRTAEPKAVSATVPTPAAGGGFVVGTNVVFVAGPPAIAQSTIQVPTTAVVADLVETAGVVVAIRDRFGNPVAGVPVRFAAEGAGNALSVVAAETAAQGAAGTALRSTMAGDKRIVASVGAASAPLFVLTSAPIAFVAGDPAPDNTSLEPADATAVADDATAIVFTITVKDAFGNLVKSLPGLSMSASGSANGYSTVTDGSTVGVDGVKGTTGADGRFGMGLSTRTAEVKTVTATVPTPLAGGSFDKHVAATFTAGAPSQASSTIAVDVATLPANGIAAASVAVMLRDQFGNPVPGIRVSFAATGSGNSFAPQSADSNASGLVSSSFRSTVAEPKSIAASVGALFVLATSPVECLPGDADATTTTLTAVQGATADGTSAAIVALAVKDALGNPLRNFDGIGIAVGGSFTTPPTASGATDADGVFAVAVRTTKAETKPVTATIRRPAAGVDLTLTSSVTFVAGPAAPPPHTFMTASKDTVVADGVDAATFLVAFRDQFDNDAPAPVQTTVRSSDAGQGDLLGAASFAGTSMSVTLSATLATAVKTVTADVIPGAGAAPFPVSASVAFIAGPPSAARSTLTPADASATTDAPGNAISFVATFSDQYGNAVAGKELQIASDGSANVLSPGSGTTGVDGRFSFALSSTKAETKQVAAALIDSGVSVSATATFLPGAPSPARSTFTSAPTAPGATSVLADGSQTFTLTAVVRDANDNAVGNVPVQFSGSGRSNIFSLPSGATDTSGVVQSRLASLAAQTEEVTATIASSTNVASVTFTSLPWMRASTGLNGARAHAVAVDPVDSKVYLATDAGLYRSADRGATWQIAYGLATRQVDSVAAASVTATSSVVYAFAFTSLYRSTDGGLTFSLAGVNPTENPGANAFVVDPANPQVLITGKNRSLDGGATWTASTGGVHANSVAFDRTTSALYLAGFAQVSKSIDGGATWTAISNGPKCSGNASVAVDQASVPSAVYVQCSDLGSLWKSSNAGASWTLAVNPTTSVGALYADLVVPNTLYAGSASTGSIYKTVDGAATWQVDLSRNSGGFGAINSLAADPQDHTRLFAAALDVGLLRTTSATAGWTVSNAGLEVPDVSFMVADTRNGGTYYAVGNGVKKTSDGAATWNPLGDVLLFGGSRPTLAVDGAGAVYAAAPGVFAPVHKLVGSSWTPLFGFPAQRFLWKMAADRASTNAVYVSTRDTANNWHAYKTTDGGATWPELVNAPPQIDQWAISPQAPSTVYARWTGFASRSTDGGTTWTVIYSFPDMDALAAAPSAANVVYSAHQDRALRRYNGTFFTTLPATAFGVAALAVAPWDASTLFAATPQGATMRSTDGGATWLDVSSGIWPPASFSEAPFAFGAPGTVLRGTFTGVFKTTTGGL